VSSTLLTPIISVIGTVLVAIIALRGQRAVSRAAIEAENTRLRERLQGEEAARVRERRRDQLIDALAELLATADPQVSAKLDYGRAVTLIHRIQLLLDLHYRSNTDLSAALNRLGYQIQAYIAVQDRPAEERTAQVGFLLTAQSDVTVAARVVIHSGVELVNGRGDR
jgi:hypothetical protein